MTPEERLDRIETIHAEMIEMSRQDRAAYIAWKRDMESQVQSTWLAIERNERSVKEWAEENKREWARWKQETAERETRIDARIEKLVGAIMKLVESRK